MSKDSNNYSEHPSLLPNNVSLDAIDHFCLSLAEPLRRMDFMSQQRAKEKFFKIINEELEKCYEKN